MSITAALSFSPHPSFASTLRQLVEHDVVERIFVAQAGDVSGLPPKCERLPGGALGHGSTLAALLQLLRTDYLLLVTAPDAWELASGGLRRWLEIARQTEAGWAYADYGERLGDQLRPHPLCEYQLGSLRDSFDFGPLVLADTAAAQAAIDKYGPPPDGDFAALYDLRLKLSCHRLPLRIPEKLYTKIESDGRASGAKQFDYVDPSNHVVQQEMERAATQHLRRLGAYLPPPAASPAVATPRAGEFAVVASIVIPVRNRVRTIGDALRSAASQVTDFSYNVLVVDNHSRDGTTALVAEFSASDDRIRHLVPQRRDLEIGGCWNHAIASEVCGRFAVQLDSDDLYQDEHTLQRIVDLFRREACGMVVGSYTLVDRELQLLPPGLIDHREWTRDNGHNNALRINGLGAPRAFQTRLLREHPFPNVSYGEDYAVALRFCRQYPVGRIFDSLYLCRRWEGNTDAALPLETSRAHDEYKDKLRSWEILERQRLNLTFE